MTQTFHVGAVSVTLDGIDLRDIRWQGHEAIRRIYPVFQDRNWTNRPFSVAEVTAKESADEVLLSAEGTGGFDAEPLQWSVRARITSAGIDYRFTAQTTRPFLRNRLGMCVLHPMSAAGYPVTVEHVDSTQTSSRLPKQISAHQPFVDIRAITHDLPNGATATVRMTGETFEMEDHRNWTDASFKTYCTPITLPFPVEVQPDDVLDQEVSVSFTPGSVITVRDQDVVSIELTGDRTDLPRLGTTLSDLSSRAPLTQEQIRSVASLDLEHLRVVIDPNSPDAREQLVTAARCAQTIGMRLRVASTCSSPDQLTHFADTPGDVLSLIDCCYVFSSQHKVTPDAWAALARAALGPGFDDIPLGGGTDLYFTELNREPPDATAFDVLNFSLNPQVHAFDDRTLIQNTMTQAVVAHNAARLSRPAQLSVSPISLRPRFNPNATDPKADVSNTALPSDVDERQRTYFAANWTAMSIKYLAQSGVIGFATYFEAAGWKGLMERAEGSSDEENFPSQPGELFPVWEVFANLVGMRHSLTCVSSDPESVDALVVEGNNRRSALVANWTDTTQQVCVAGEPLRTLPAHSLTTVALPTCELPARSSSHNS